MAEWMPDMPAMTFKVHGLDELKTRLKRLERDVQNKIARKAARLAAKPILAEMRQRVPVDTGGLRRRLGIRIKKTRLGPVAIVGPRGRSHAWFLEFGTEKMHAQPFVAPAVRATEDTAAETLKREAVNGIRDATNGVL